MEKALGWPVNLVKDEECPGEDSWRGKGNTIFMGDRNHKMRWFDATQTFPACSPIPDVLSSLKSIGSVIGAIFESGPP